MKKRFTVYPLFVSLLSLAAIFFCLVFVYTSMIGPLLILFFSFLAIYCMGHTVFKNFAFTVWVFSFVTASMFYPQVFGIWFGYDLKILIIPLIQIIMFGMGTTLSVYDFKRVITMPWPVLIGIFLQFTVMPLTGFAIAILFRFEPEIAAGVILIGSCPGGVASNLMTYLAGGNVALSVSMTSCSTLISPLMTPLLMKTLAGRLVPINFIAMMFSILNMIIVPIVAGICANYILYNRKKWVNTWGPLSLTSIISLILAAVLHLSNVGLLGALKSGIVLGLILIGIVALAKLIVSLWLKGPEDWMDKTLPIISMAGICFIIGIITARSGDKLLTVGLALIAATIMHNFIGYVLGYWVAKAVRLEEKSCRTVAFEVGMQNGGMASGLAMGVLNSAKAALAPAIFGPWMNISGSMLATWWHRKPTSYNHRRDENSKKLE
jgi:BASS family bile acid:Na+ symporter